MRDKKNSNWKKAPSGNAKLLRKLSVRRLRLLNLFFNSTSLL